MVAMTELLELAISRLKTLPVNDQNAIASIILEKLEDALRWDTACTDSSDVLAKLTATAIAKHRAGKTQELNPETL